jgi:aspartyl-tRNA(Asn)/glutamyl-tRNA(Gln) amidotransferase subunit A
VPDIAPMGLSTTGDQTYLTPWTALGGPLVSLPAGHSPEGMPLGILLAAAPGRDDLLVHTATRLAVRLPKTASARLTSAEA